MAKPLIALIHALGPWPSALLLFTALLLVCGSIVLIVLRSNIAINIHRDSKNKWGIRFVRVERGGRIDDLTLFPMSQESAPKIKRKSLDKIPR